MFFHGFIGSEHLIGLAGAGASSGMAMAHWEIQGWMILILGCEPCCVASTQKIICRVILLLSDYPNYNTDKSQKKDSDY